MAQPPELARLAEQRRRLVVSSGLLRQQLADDFAELQSSAVWIERAYALTQASRAYWPILAGLAGLLLARGRGSWLGKAGKLWSWWRMARRLASLWHSFRAEHT